jgi:hypothetical protein
MLGAKPETDESCGNARKEGQGAQQPRKAMKKPRTPVRQHSSDNRALNEELQSLGSARRALSAALNGAQIVFREAAVSKFGDQYVRGGNRVLDRQIDADAADRRHRMRRIADTEQSGAIPLT